MTGETLGLAERARTLGLAFDQSFVHEARRDATAMENLVALTLGGEPYALRLTEIAGLFMGRKITPVPGGIAGLLGIAGFRGSIVPVYDLGVLLGHPASPAPRWLAIAAAAPVALAFDTFAGHLRIGSQTITAREAGQSSTQLIREFVSTADEVRQVVRVASVVDAIRAQLPTISRG